MMSPNAVFVFSGENAFAIREERRKWTQSFIEKHNRENLHCLEAENIHIGDFINEISVAPFISEKRLVVVDGIPRWTGEEMKRVFSQMHPQSVLLLVSPTIDRRREGVRILLKNAKHQIFPLLKVNGLHTWMEQVARSAGVSLSRDARDRLLDLVGTDQDMLFQEIQKLALGKAEITVRDIDALVVPSREWIEWHLNNVVARGHPKEAIRCAGRLLHEGENAFALWNKLLVMVRQLTMIVAAFEAGCTQPNDIGERQAIHPFVVASLLPLARRMSLGDMRVLIDDIVEMDRALKTGRLRATADDATELHALIDQCVLAISSMGTTSA